MRRYVVFMRDNSSISKLKKALLDQYGVEEKTAANIFLSEFHTKYFSIIEQLQQNLNHFAVKSFSRDWEGQLSTDWTTTKKEQLDAYLSIDGILQWSYTRSDKLKALLAVIEDQKNNIHLSFANRLISASPTLLEMTAGFKNDAENLVKQYMTMLYNKKDHPVFIVIFLLDDHFYHVLDDRKKFDLIAQLSPSLFFRILKLIRPEEFERLMNDDTFKIICETQVGSDIDIPLVEIPQEELQEVLSQDKRSPEESHVQLKPMKHAKQFFDNFENSFAYQLLELDLHVGFKFLREEKPDHCDVLFLPPHRIELYDFKEISEKYKEKMCLGIFCVHGNHFFTAVMYTPSQGRTQILFIDPRALDEDKQK